jgi:hypothetical protein
VVAIENVSSAIDQIAQTTLRSVVGRHTLDETLSETDAINTNIREILDVQTEDWGTEVTVVELKDIQLPDGMKRAMARQAEAEREKRAKIIAAEGEALAAGQLAEASDVMMAHPLALQLRNLQTLLCGLTGRWLVRAREQAVPWDAFALEQTSVANGEAVTIGCCQQPMGTASNFPVRRTSRPRSLGGAHDRLSERVFPVFLGGGNKT